MIRYLAPLPRRPGGNAWPSRASLAAVPPLDLVSSRASGTLYAQTGATTAAAYAPGSTPVTVTPGDVDPLTGTTLPGGTFGGPGWTNSYPSAFSLTGWTSFNATQGVPADRTAPDGSLTAFTIIDAAGDTAWYINTSGLRLSQVWYKYPTASPTVLGSYLGNATSIPLPATATPTEWSLFTAYAVNTTSAGVTGLSATPWNTGHGSDQGTIIVAAAQTVAGATLDYAYLPIVDGTAAATVLSVSDADAAKVIISGRLDVEVTFRSLYLLTSGWNILSGRVVVMSGTSTDGSFEVARATSGDFELLVRGVVVLTVPASYVQVSDGPHTGGQWHSVRAWYDTAAGTCGIRQTVNGVVTQTTGTTTGTALAPLSAFWVGSSEGTSNFFIGLYDPQGVRVHSTAPTSAFEIAIVGDSEPGHSVSPSLGASLYTYEQSTTRPGIFSIARGGAHISDALTFWNASSNLARGNPSIRAVVVECGTNDGLAAVPAATAAASMATLTAKIRADNPWSTIVLMGIVPIYSFPTFRAAYNAILMDPSGGVYADVRLDCPAALDDGAGAIAAAYAIDTIHPSTAGKRLQAGPLRTAIGLP